MKIRLHKISENYIWIANAELNEALVVIQMINSTEKKPLILVQPEDRFKSYPPLTQNKLMEMGGQIKKIIGDMSPKRFRSFRFELVFDLEDNKEKLDELQIKRLVA